MGTAAVELRIFDRGFRSLLQPYAVIEVWTGPALVGSISGRTLTLIVEHHLAAAALAAGLQAELTDAAPERLHPVRKPLQPMLAEAERAQRRARRRTRRKITQ